jgi:aspartokinase-like uncharacterized kinase
MDAVLKVGGSLAENPEELRLLCVKLSDYALKYDLAVVPGGGQFADVVREFDRTFILSPATTHKMAILGMDQYGLLLADLTPQFHLITALEDVFATSEDRSLKIIMPSTFMSEDDPLENSWNVTSDSIAAYFAHRLQAPKLILITDVDGIFTKNPKLYSDAVLFHTVRTNQLLTLDMKTCVDKSLPKLLLDYSICCYVVNGRHPERIGSILSGQPAIYTKVIANHEKV